MITSTLLIFAASFSFAQYVPPLDRPLTPEETAKAEAAIGRLASPDKAEQATAFGDLRWFGPYVVELLASKGLAFDSVIARRNVVRILEQIASKNTFEPLVGVALNDKEDSETRQMAMKAAIAVDAARSLEPVKAMLKSSRDTVRYYGALHARLLRDKSLIAPLIQTLSDPARFVSIAAFESLGYMTRAPISAEGQFWEESTQEQRAEWSVEWKEWWAKNEAAFEFPPARKKTPRPVPDEPRRMPDLPKPELPAGPPPAPNFDL